MRTPSSGTQIAIIIIIMRIYLTSDVPISTRGYTESVADELFASGHEVVVITPSPRLKIDKPYPVHSTLFRPTTPMTDNLIMTQMWAFNLSTLIYGQPDVILNPNAGTWNYVTSAFPTVFVNRPTPLSDVTRRGIQRADGIIALTRGDASTIARSAFYDVPSSKITVIPLGLDPELFDTTIESSRENLLSRYAQELQGVDENAFWIVASTDVAQSGDIDTLIRAAQSYEANSNRPVMTLIVGVLDEPQLEKYQHLTERLIIQGVRFVNGLKDREDATRFLKEADVVVVSGRDGASSLAKDVLDIAPPDDQSSAAAIKWAMRRITDNTKTNAPLRTELLSYLGYELQRTLGRLDAIEPVCSTRCREESAKYIKFATRQIATENLADGVSIQANASTKRVGVDHTRSFETLTRSYGWNPISSRIEDYLRKAAGRTSRIRSIRVETPLDLVVGSRKERLNSIGFDEDVMESFERFKKTRGTDQFGRALMTFDRTVSEYFGTRTGVAHPLDMTAMPDPRSGNWGVFAEVARASGISTSQFMEVMREVETTPRTILTGMEYQKPPMRPDATIIRIPFGKPR